MGNRLTFLSGLLSSSISTHTSDHVSFRLTSSNQSIGDDENDPMMDIENTENVNRRRPQFNRNLFNKVDMETKKGETLTNVNADVSSSSSTFADSDVWSERNAVILLSQHKRNVNVCQCIVDDIIQHVSMERRNEDLDEVGQVEEELTTAPPILPSTSFVSEEQKDNTFFQDYRHHKNFSSVSSTSSLLSTANTNFESAEQSFVSVISSNSNSSSNETISAFCQNEEDCDEELLVTASTSLSEVGAKDTEESEHLVKSTPITNMTLLADLLSKLEIKTPGVTKISEKMADLQIETTPVKGERNVDVKGSDFIPSTKLDFNVSSKEVSGSDVVETIENLEEILDKSSTPIAEYQDMLSDSQSTDEVVESKKINIMEMDVANSQQVESIKSTIRVTVSNSDESHVVAKNLDLECLSEVKLDNNEQHKTFCEDGNAVIDQVINDIIDHCIHGPDNTTSTPDETITLQLVDVDVQKSSIHTGDIESLEKIELMDDIIDHCIGSNDDNRTSTPDEENPVTDGIAAIEFVPLGENKENIPPKDFIDEHKDINSDDVFVEEKNVLKENTSIYLSGSENDAQHENTVVADNTITKEENLATFDIEIKPTNEDNGTSCVDKIELDKQELFVESVSVVHDQICSDAGLGENEVAAYHHFDEDQPLNLSLNDSKGAESKEGGGREVETGQNQVDQSNSSPRRVNIDNILPDVVQTNSNSKTKESSSQIDVDAKKDEGDVLRKDSTPEFESCEWNAILEEKDHLKSLMEFGDKVNKKLSPFDKSSSMVDSSNSEHFTTSCMKSKSPSSTKNSSVFSPFSVDHCQMGLRNQAVADSARQGTSSTSYSPKNQILQLEQQERILERDGEIHELNIHLNLLQNEKEDLEDRILNFKKINIDMRHVVDEYERTMSDLIREREKERNTQEVALKGSTGRRSETHRELESTTQALNDLTRKYERCKDVVLQCQQTERVAMDRVKGGEEQLKKADDKLQRLKEEASKKIEQANEVIAKLDEKAKSNRTRMTAAIRKAEMRVNSLESAIQSKSRENGELSSICDELIAKIDHQNIH